jgi:hypothetical protein
MRHGPSDAVILERAKSFCNEACFTVALQCRRLRTVEPEDKTFVFRWHADLQFLIVALRRLRRSVELAQRVSAVAPALKTALDDFDRQLPDLAKMRNVAEHIDDYLLGTGRLRNVPRGALQVATWDGTEFNWLGVRLDIDVALSSAESLFGALARAVTPEKRV